MSTHPDDPSVSHALPPDMPRRLGGYEIERRLAAGGMSDVYLARDRRLDRAVAVKHVRARSEAATAQLWREARTVAGLSHSAIVQVFDIVESPAGAWIVMEHIDGPTLFELLRRGPLDIERALELAGEVAAGLAAAHARGFIHRDLKTENVMVTPEGRAKILDFGLATPVAEAATAASGEERLVGTCRAMAPEQAMGQQLDPRSDLFAFGVLLYELVTGESPFQGPTRIATLSRVCTFLQAPAREINGDVPEALSRLIDRLLDKDPERRPRSAEEVGRRLAAVARELEPPSADETTASELGGRGLLEGLETARRSSRRRHVAGFVAALARGLLLAVLWRLGTAPGDAERPASAVTPATSRALPAPTERRGIVVLGFRNLSDEPAIGWLERGLSVLLLSELAASPELWTVSAVEAEELRQDLDLRQLRTLSDGSLARIRERVGADLVVVGTFFAASPDRLLAIVNVQSTDPRGRQITLRQEGERHELERLMSEVGRKLRRQLGLEELAAAAAAQARAGLPDDPHALQLYVQGLEAMRRHDGPAARALLQRSIGQQEGKALVHAALADVLSDLGYASLARAEAARAIELAAALSRQDQLWIQGRSFELAHDWPAAVDTYRSLHLFYPENRDYAFRLVEALIRSGRSAEAFAELEGLRQDADSLRLDMAQAKALWALSDLRRLAEVAAAAASRAKRQGASLALAQARFLEGVALVRLGQVAAATAAAEASLRLARTAGDPRGIERALCVLAQVAYEEGDHVRGRELLEEVREHQERHGNRRGIARTLSHLAALALRQGRLGDAEALLEQAAAELVELGGDLVREPVLRGHRAHLLLRRGRLDEALAEAEGALRRVEPSHRGEARQQLLAVLGRVHLTRGELAAARRHFEAGLEASRAGGLRFREADFLADLAALEAAAGRRRPSRDLLEEAAGRRLEGSGPAAEDQVALARLDLADGRPAAAVDRLDGALAVLDRLALPEAELRAWTTLAAARAALGDPTAAGRATARARQLLERCESVGLRREATAELRRLEALLGTS